MAVQGALSAHWSAVTPDAGTPNAAVAPQAATQPSAGGSFLRGAAQTAVGFAAGQAIFSGIGDLFN